MFVALTNQAELQKQVWEIIQAPSPIKATRPTNLTASMSDYYAEGNTTTYIHLLLNQRTVPLHKSYPECEQRDDGWCELSTVMKIFGGLLDTARYEYSCFGAYPSTPNGNVTDGVPTVKRRALSRSFGTGLEMYDSGERWME